MKNSSVKKQSLSLGELQRLDSLITIAQEQGLKLNDLVQIQSDICCCGALATAATVKGRFVINPDDRAIFSKVRELANQLSSPTLQQLIEARGTLLREQ